MNESRFDKMTLTEIRKELWKRRCLSDVAVGETVLRLSLDRPYDLSREIVSKTSRSSVYLESMKGTRFDKANGMQVNHKGYSKGNVCFNTKGLSENDISTINVAYSSMNEMEEYIDAKLKANEILGMKSLIFTIKNAHPNDTWDVIYMFMRAIDRENELNYDYIEQ